MDNFHDVGSYLAQSTFFQLQLCLKALDLMGCTMAAISVAHAIGTAREELERKPSPGPLFRPDEDFAEMDAMAAEMFSGKLGRSPF